MSVQHPKQNSKRKKARVEDALHATRAALAEGIVPGGGVSFIRAQDAIAGTREWKAVFGKVKEVTSEDVGQNKFDFAAGLNVVHRALSVPLRTIAENAGAKGSVVVAKVAEAEGSNGYNALTDTYEDLIKAGVITPAKVDRSALINAGSVATMLLAADCIITNKPEKAEPISAGPEGMGGMGGMGGGMPGMGGMGGMPGMGGMGF